MKRPWLPEQLRFSRCDVQVKSANGVDEMHSDVRFGSPPCAIKRRLRQVHSAESVLEPRACRRRVHRYGEGRLSDPA